MPDSDLLDQYGLDGPLGPMVLLFDGQGRLRFLDFEENGERLRRWLGRQRLAPRLRQGPPPASAGEPMAAYFAGELDALDRIPRAFGGSPFQQAVWTALERIPAGGTSSYGLLARAMGKEAAVRAVGAAVGANPISLVVPCHRVLGSDGSLTGYAGGLPRKQWLLRHEGVLVGLGL